jgi:hypothetical protein
VSFQNNIKTDQFGSVNQFLKRIPTTTTATTTTTKAARITATTEQPFKNKVIIAIGN